MRALSTASAAMESKGVGNPSWCEMKHNSGKRSEVMYSGLEVKGSWNCLWSESSSNIGIEEEFRIFADLCAKRGYKIPREYERRLVKSTAEGRFEISLTLSHKTKPPRWIVGEKQLKTGEELTAEFHGSLLGVKNNSFHASAPSRINTDLRDSLQGLQVVPMLVRVG